MSGELSVKWQAVNGNRVDAESIAKWFFQVDDPRQRECEALVSIALEQAAALAEKPAERPADDTFWREVDLLVSGEERRCPKDPTHEMSWRGMHCQVCGTFVGNSPSPKELAIALQTERTLHNAWEKRAYQAERERAERPAWEHDSDKLDCECHDCQKNAIEQLSHQLDVEGAERSQLSAIRDSLELAIEHVKGERNVSAREVLEGLLALLTGEAEKVPECVVFTPGIGICGMSEGHKEPHHSTPAERSQLSARPQLTGQALRHLADVTCGLAPAWMEFRWPKLADAINRLLTGEAEKETAASPEELTIHLDREKRCTCHMSNPLYWCRVHGKSPAAPPVIQAEPTSEDVLGEAENLWVVLRDLDDYDETLRVIGRFAIAIRREAERAARAQIEKEKWEPWTRDDGSPLICSICEKEIPRCESGWMGDSEQKVVQHMDCGYQQRIKELERALADSPVSGAAKETK